MAENVLDYLEESADKYPQKIAYVDKYESITYEELREQTYKIADRLIKKRYKKKPISIYLQKSVRCIATMLGVLYSGNYYTVLDMDMPLERIKKIAFIFSPVIVITDETHREQCEEILSQYDILTYEHLLSNAYDNGRIRKRKEDILPTDLSQVIFTSGSTGTPKGVMLSHGGIVSATESETKLLGCSKSDIFANQFPFHFVGYLVDLFCTLKTGATDYIIPKELFFSPKHLVDFLEEKKVTILDWVASALCLIAKYGALTDAILPCVKIIFSCGESMPIKYLHLWQRALPKATFINAYGSSELSGGILFYRVNREFGADDQLPLGFPIEEAEIFLIDENGENRKDEGELCVRSNQLAIGYYKNDKETLKKFIQMHDKSGQKMNVFKTGDLVKYNEWGELIFTGRKDFQIKRHGYRIELGEIEYAVNRLDEISDAACIYDQYKEKIVLFFSGHITNIKLRKSIEEIVPHHMIPDAYIEVEEIPRNINKKIDRIKLNTLYKEIATDVQ